VSGCFSPLALRTILSVLLTGHRSGWAMLDDSVIVLAFWQFFLYVPGDPGGVGYLESRIITNV
jgi:hypothetical protein